MIRILNVVYGMNRGGIETFIMNIYRKIDRNKIQFDFLLHTEEECDYNVEIKELGGKIFYVPQRNKGVLNNKRALNDFFKYSFSLDAISEKLETARPLHEAAYDISVLDSHPIKKYGLGIPLLLKFHTASLPLIRMSYLPFIFFITIS